MRSQEIMAGIPTAAEDREAFTARMLDEAVTARANAHRSFAGRDYASAETFYWRALALYKEATGAYTLELADVLDDLGELYELQGRRESACRFYQFAHVVKEHVLGAFNPVLARSARRIEKMMPRDPEFQLAFAS